MANLLVPVGLLALMGLFAWISYKSNREEGK